MVSRDLNDTSGRMRMMTPATALGIPGLGRGLVLFLMLAVGTLALSGIANASGQRLEGWDFSALSGNKVQIRLDVSGMLSASEVSSFTIDNPARIALDFPETASEVPRQMSIGAGAVRSINAVESRGRTRVVVNLDSMVPYAIRVEDGAVYVIVEGPGIQRASSGVSALEAAVSSRGDRNNAAPGRAITKVDFHRGTNREGRLLITLSDPKTPVSVERVADRVTVDFAGAHLPEDLRRRMDVVDFATPVTLIDSFKEDGKVRFEIATEGVFEHMAYQTDSVFTLEVNPVTEEEVRQAAQDKAEFSGERLTLNFQDIELRAVLQIIADFTDMNMVTSDSVQGSVTLRLQNVPWDQALDIVLKSKGLAMRQVGNVIMVAPAQEIAAREKQQFESQQQIQELSPLFSDLIQVNYAKAEDMAVLLKARENSMLSERGSVTVDTRTNALLVRDTTDKLVDIRKLVSRLDIPVRQVLIESRVVVANDDFSRDLGVRMGTTAVREHGSGGVMAISGSLAGTGAMVDSAPLPVNLPSLDNRLNINLPAANTSGQPGQFALAVLGSDYLIDLELSAMQAEGRGEVVSTPRVITSNQNTASIAQGVEIPYLTAASSGATTVQFKKAVLGLTVKPQITPDDRIIMDLTVSKDSVGQIFQGIPSVNTREVVTQVLVNNGETVVLGGIYEQERAEAVSKIPFLGDLPFLGALFRQSSNVDRKNELLIFVTPKILKESLTMQ